MQIYKTNRTVEGLKPGTLVIREHDLPLNYNGAMTVLVLNEKVQFNDPDAFYEKTIARSRLTHVETIGVDKLLERLVLSLFE